MTALAGVDYPGVPAGAILWWGAANIFFVVAAVQPRAGADRPRALFGVNFLLWLIFAMGVSFEATITLMES